MLKDFTKEKFDIIIQAGQSNAEGYGFGPVEKPYVPNDNVFYLNPDLTIFQACEKVSGNEIQSNFGLSFAQEYINAGKLNDGRKLLILRCAWGGTGFSDKRWGMKDDLYLHMMKMIRAAVSLNSENRLIAMLWHQGETDAQNKVSYDTHYANLTALLESVRSTFNTEALPFIAGDFVQEWKNNNIDIATPIVDAIRAVCCDCGCGGFVESDGLMSNSQALSYYSLRCKDTIHFCRESVYELGVRYFKCFESIASASAK